jgi:hypothetical protein
MPSKQAWSPVTSHTSFPTTSRYILVLVYLSPDQAESITIGEFHAVRQHQLNMICIIQIVGLQHLILSTIAAASSSFIVSQSCDDVAGISKILHGKEHPSENTFLFR